jgi:DNA replication protein DnaC
VTSVDDPVLATVEDLAPLSGDDARERRYWIEEHLEQGRKRISKQVPPRYAEAIVTVPEIARWTRQLLTAAAEARPMVPAVTRGHSLLLLGPTGTGKTHQAFGIVRAISVSGVSCQWMFVTSADLYAKLRPRARVDSEVEFDRYARAPLLVIDDLGAAKATEWTEEVNYRLINHRYEYERPTIVTSNVPPRELGAVLGDRVRSRLTEMADFVTLKGEDRRLARQS